MFYQLEHIGAAGSLKREEGENFSYPSHLHQCFELILLKEGEMTVEVDGASYRMEKGRALLRVYENARGALLKEAVFFL